MTAYIPTTKETIKQDIINSIDGLRKECPDILQMSGGSLPDDAWAEAMYHAILEEDLRALFDPELAKKAPYAKEQDAMTPLECVKRKGYASGYAQGFTTERYKILYNAWRKNKHEIATYLAGTMGLCFDKTPSAAEAQLMPIGK